MMLIAVGSTHLDARSVRLAAVSPFAPTADSVAVKLVAGRDRDREDGGVPLPDLHPVLLRSDLVVVREVEQGDAEAAFAWGSDPEYFAYLPFEPVQTMDQEHAFVDEVIRAARTTPRRGYHLAVTVAATAEMVGLVDLRITSVRHRSAELGFGLRKDARGQGLATEAAELVVDFGFRVLGLHRITAGHHPDNVASGRLLERLGMKREGRLRENLLSHGTWRDSIVYSVLEHEWRRPVD